MVLLSLKEIQYMVINYPQPKDFHKGKIQHLYIYDVINRQKYSSESPFLPSFSNPTIHDIDDWFWMVQDARQEDPYGGLVEQEGDYNSVLGFPTGGHHILALGLQPNNNHHHHLHSGGGSDITTFALGWVVINSPYCNIIIFSPIISILMYSK